MFESQHKDDTDFPQHQLDTYPDTGKGQMDRGLRQHIDDKNLDEAVNQHIRDYFLSNQRGQYGKRI